MVPERELCASLAEGRTNLLGWDYIHGGRVSLYFKIVRMDQGLRCLMYSSSAQVARFTHREAVISSLSGLMQRPLVTASHYKEK